MVCLPVFPSIGKAYERESLAFGFPLLREASPSGRGTGKPNKGIHQCLHWFMYMPQACTDIIRSPHPLHKKRPPEAVIFLERMRGIEPPLSAWEAGVLPMNYIRVYGKYSTEPKKNQSPFRRFFSTGSTEEQWQDKIVLSPVGPVNDLLIFTSYSTIFNCRTVAG